MWEFPRAEVGQEERLAELLGSGTPEPAGTIRHSVTHHRIELRVFVVELVDQIAGLEWMTPQELREVALPSPQKRAFELVLQSANTLLGDSWS
jgi:adenine-specific DNA glycosylase